MTDPDAAVPAPDEDRDRRDRDSAEAYIKACVKSWPDDVQTRMLVRFVAEYDRRAQEIEVLKGVRNNLVLAGNTEFARHEIEVDDLIVRCMERSGLLRGMARRATTLRSTGEAEIKRLREEMDKFSGGWEARVNSRQRLRDKLARSISDSQEWRDTALGLHAQLADMYILRSQVADVRALADELDKEAATIEDWRRLDQGNEAQQMREDASRIRAALVGTTDTPREPGPTAPECDTCGHERSEHDSAGVCRVVIRPTWAPDDECFCGRFVEESPVSPREDETPEPAPMRDPEGDNLCRQVTEYMREAHRAGDDVATAWRNAGEIFKLDASAASVSTTPDPAALARWLYRNYGGGTTQNGDWHQPPWSDLNDTIRDAWITEANDAVRAALAGTATTPQPVRRVTEQQGGPPNDAIEYGSGSQTFDDGPGVACGCCEIDWQLCRGLYDKGMARCCADCTHNLAGVPSPLLGTYADPEFRAHQDHKHPVEGCGYCPSSDEEASDG